MKAVTSFDAYSGNTGIRLVWDLVKDARNYDIYKKADGEKKFSLLKTVDDMFTGYTDKKVEAGKGYSYYIVAKDGNDVSKPSKTDYEFYMAVPQVDFANNNPPEGILITWTAIPKADGYRVWKEINGKSQIVAVVKELQYLDKDVKHATRYKYSIQAIHKIGNITYSSLHPVKSSYFIKKSDIKIVSSGVNVKVIWSADFKMSGQHIHWSTDPDFPSDNRTAISIDNNKDTSKTFKAPAGKTIYVRTQKYLYVGDKRYWGAYSDVKKIKVLTEDNIFTYKSAIPIKNKGDSYSIKLNTKLGEKKVTAYRQGAWGIDAAGRWLKGSGCGVCSLLTATAPYVDKFKGMTPKGFYNGILAKKELGEISRTGSIGFGGMTKLLKKYSDVTTKVVQTYKYTDAVEDIRKHLYTGQPVIITVRSQNFNNNNKTDKKYTSWAHFIALLGMTEDGKVIVADSSLHNWSLGGSGQIRFKLGDLTDIVNHTQSISKPSSPSNYYTHSGSNGYMKIYIK